jgi:pyridoxamine 5'-phosphate oxidase family protein
MTAKFSATELAYLGSQRLGRLATVDRNGAPQNNPVGFWIDDRGEIVIGGRAMGESRKFGNVERNPNVALVVDDIASVDPWTVRMVEVRGTALALRDVDPPMKGMSREIIRITPQWIKSFGLA